MVLFIGFAVLVAAVVWAVTRPLLATPTATPAAADTELAVYRDQLAEIEAERTQGMVAGADAEAARAEVARRLIRRAEEKKASAAPSGAQTTSARNTVLAAAAALPVAALLLYLAVGSPMLPGRPYASRLTEPIEQATASDLVAKVEAHLRQHPDDGRGWDVVAPVYLHTRDFQHAADAFQRAIRLLGESPKRLAGFARATIMLQNGVVTEPARRAYEKLRTLEPDAIEPQVWLAIAKEQDGDLAGAAADYRALIAEGASQQPWRTLLEARLKSVTAKLGGAPEAAQGGDKSGSQMLPPPSAEAMAKFHAMTPEQRQQFIERMVEGLAARLKQDGKNLEGWMQLMRAYAVLGRSKEASSALAQARSNFAGDEKSLAQLQALAQSLGIGS